MSVIDRLVELSGNSEIIGAGSCAVIMGSPEQDTDEEHNVIHAGVGEAVCVTVQCIKGSRLGVSQLINKFTHVDYDATRPLMTRRFDSEEYATKWFNKNHKNFLVAIQHTAPTAENQVSEMKREYAASNYAMQAFSAWLLHIIHQSM